MLPAYTYALGKTAAIDELMTFLMSQEEVYKAIIEKQSHKQDYAIGGDATLDRVREEVAKRESEVKG